MPRILRIVLAMFVGAALAGGVAIAATGSPQPSSNPPGHASPNGRAQPNAVQTANSSPRATFVPSPDQTVYVPIAPCAIADTRQSTILKKTTTRSFVVRGNQQFAPQGGKAGGCGIPVSATAVSATLTALAPAATGYLQVWPVGTANPPGGSRVLSYQHNIASTASATLTLGGANTNGQKNISIRTNGGNTQLIIAVTGYYDTQQHLIILADGTVWYGNSQHVTEVIHTPGTGNYALVFDHSLAGCNVLTTSNDQRDVQAIGSWGGSTLTVLTSHENAGVFTQTDESFQLFVAC